MSKTYDVVVFEKQKEKLVSISCDWCGCSIEVEGYYSRPEFTLRVEENRVGCDSVNGGEVTGWSVEDLCTECRNKLRKLLKIAGILVTPFCVEW